MTTPPDPNLPARLRSAAIVADGEQRVGRAWFRSMSRFLDRIRPSVMSGGRIDPGRVSDSQAFWTEEVDVRIIPTVRSILDQTLSRVTGRPAVNDTWVSDYLNTAGNRMSNIPHEVYGLIVAEIERGIREGTGIPGIAEQVDTILRANGSERWPNRAVVVARTETMGAVNAGVYRGAVLDAERRGDVAPFKVWLATEDARTRPTHVAADGQRTLLTEPFSVGGAPLQFPGDPRGPAQEVIQCRCTMLPVVLGETIDWTNRQFNEGAD